MIKRMGFKEGFSQVSFLWQKYIDTNVIVSDLEHNVLNITRSGVQIDYVIYCLLYVIKHKMNLKYPAGLKYYINRYEIKRAFSLSKINRVEIYDFNIGGEAKSPKFNYKPQEVGFLKILEKHQMPLDN